MAEIVGSAVVEEVANRIMSNLINKNEKYDERGNIERLEMAHIKIEAALEMSNRWQIADVPLLRWRSKLKRAAQECDDTLRHCKQRILEEEEMRKVVSQSSFPRRIAHMTNSLISSFINRNNNDESSSHSASVQRFERFADGANEFLKFVEFGGTPRQYMFFNPLIGNLFTGKRMRYRALQGSRFYYLSIRPMSFEERGLEAMIGFSCMDFKTPMKSFDLGFMLRLSESTDIFGIIIKCMQAVTPHLKFAAEGVKRALIQLPTQDFSWVADDPYSEKEYWLNVYSTLTQWFRPNPLCCNEHEYATCSTRNSANKSSSRLSNIFPEQVIVVLLRCHISLSDQRNRLNLAIGHGRGSSLTDRPPLKIGVLFIPHDSPQDIESTLDSYAIEVIDEKEQETIHTNARLQDVDEMLLPKAIDYLYHNTETRMYQMCLKSRHGTGHLYVEKTSTQMQNARRNKATRHVRHKRIVQQQDNRMKQWKMVSMDLLKFWVVRASDKLHSSIMSWTANLA